MLNSSPQPLPHFLSFDAMWQASETAVPCSTDSTFYLLPYARTLLTASNYPPPSQNHPYTTMQRASQLPSSSSNPNPRASLSFEERCLQFQCGQLIQALRIDSADVMLLEYQDNQVLRFLRRGEFIIKLVRHSFSPMVVTVCSVGCIHLPLARDAPVFRVGVRSFLVAVPGLLYALRFPPSCPEQRMVFLDVLLMRFCDYANFSNGKRWVPLISYPKTSSSSFFFFELQKTQIIDFSSLMSSILSIYTTSFINNVKWLESTKKTK